MGALFSRKEKIELLSFAKVFAMLLLGFAAFIGVASVSSFGGAPQPRKFPEPRPNFTVADGLRGGQLLVSVTYLHWLIYNSILPLGHLTTTERRRLIHSVRRRYAGGITIGIVAFGYFMIFGSASQLAFGFYPARPGIGLFFIALGTLLQVRAVFLNLTEPPRYNLEASPDPRAPAE